jgi:hypothetical protein
MRRTEIGARCLKEWRKEASRFYLTASSVNALRFVTYAVYAT